MANAPEDILHDLRGVLAEPTAEHPKIPQWSLEFFDALKDELQRLARHEEEETLDDAADRTKEIEEINRAHKERIEAARRGDEAASSFRGSGERTEACERTRAQGA